MPWATAVFPPRASRPSLQRYRANMGNTFGHMFRVTTWGESHGDAVGVTVDGCPPLLELGLDEVQRELDRRRPGQSDITSQRREPDRAEILSGVFEGRTLGTPIQIIVRTQDARGKDYEHMRTKYRPSHADYSYRAKYGIRDWMGAGRASARETIGRVAAAAIAKKVLEQEHGVEIVGYVKQVWKLVAEVNPDTVSAEDVESNEARCPDQDMAVRMIERIKDARKDGDSLGGVVEAVARNVPVGLGDPVFDKLEADLAKGMLSLPACKGFEVGSGFGGVHMTGSQHKRPLLQRRWPYQDAHELVRRYPGWHLQRREHSGPRGVQAHGHHHEAPGDGGRGRKPDGDGGPRTPRSLRPTPGSPHGGGDDRAGARRPRPAAAGAGGGLGAGSGVRGRGSGIQGSVLRDALRDRLDEAVVAVSTPAVEPHGAGTNLAT